MNLSILQYFKQNIKGFSTYSRENMCKSVDKLINKIERINIVGNISFLNKLYTVYTQSKRLLNTLKIMICNLSIITYAHIHSPITTTN